MSACTGINDDDIKDADLHPEASSPPCRPLTPPLPPLSIYRHLLYPLQTHGEERGRTSFFFCPPPGSTHSSRTRSTDITGSLAALFLTTIAMMNESPDAAETRL
ncbi:unnamed protein product [Boreogadus saida]